MGLRQLQNNPPAAAFDPSQPFELEEEDTSTSLPQQTPQQQQTVTIPSTSPQFSGFDPNQPFELEPDLREQLTEGIISGVVKTGEALEKYSAAPTRAAVSATIGGYNPAAAFKKQFGEDPTLAPTGGDIAGQLGVTDEPFLTGPSGEPLINVSKKDIAGGILDFGLDLTSLVPTGTLAKIGAKGAGKIAKGAGKVINLIEETKYGPEVIEGIGKLTAPVKYITKLPGKAKNKLMAATSGFDVKKIQTYTDRYEDVERLIKQYGDDVPGAADAFREKVSFDIRNRIDQLNKNIEDALDASGELSRADVTPVLDRLEKLKARLDPRTDDAGDIGQIDEMINTIKSFIKKPGDAQSINEFGVIGQMAHDNTVDLKDLVKINRYLQDRGKGAFKKNGVPFIPGKKSQQAAVQARGLTRRLTNELSPEIREANNTLALLHRLDENINKNLITPGKPEATIMAAGGGTNIRAAKQLQQVGALTGTNPLAEAENIAAAQAFNKTPIMSLDTTGKGAERLLRGSFVFEVIAQKAGLPAGYGFALGSMFTSPLAVKMAIKAGKIPKKLADFIQTPVGGRMLLDAFSTTTRETFRDKEKDKQ